MHHNGVKPATEIVMLISFSSSDGSIHTHRPFIKLDLRASETSLCYGASRESKSQNIAAAWKACKSHSKQAAISFNMQCSVLYSKFLNCQTMSRHPSDIQVNDYDQKIT